MLIRIANAAWAIFEYVWYPILIFASTPFFLGRLGPEQYGLWMLLTATVGVGAILNTGTGAATIKLISENLGNGGSAQLNAVVQNALAIALVGGAGLAFAILAIFLLGNDRIFNKMGARELIYVTGITAAILSWLEQLDNVLSSAIKGAERFGRIARLEIASKTAQILLAIIIVSTGGELLAIYVSLVIVSVMRFLAKAKLTCAMLGITKLRPSFGRMSGFLDLSKWGWLQGLGAALFNSADRFVVGSVFGATALSHYSIALMLPQQIHAIAAAGLSVIFPMISRRNAEKGSYVFDRPIALTMLGTSLLSATVATVLWLFGKQIFAAWLNTPISTETWQVYRYLIIAYLILALNIFPHYVLLGLGQVRFVALSNLVAGIIAFVVMIDFANRFGLVGVGFCRILYAIVASVIFFPLIKMLRIQRHADR